MSAPKKIKLLWIGMLSSLFVNVACSHAFAVTMTVATAGNHSDDTKILVAGILIVGVSVSLLAFFVFSYFLLSRMR